MKSQTNKKPSWYQLFQKPVLFIGVLLLLLGIYSYLNTTKGLFPEVEVPLSSSSPMHNGSSSMASA